MTPITFIISIFFWEGIEMKHLIVFVLMASSGLVANWCIAQSLKLSDTTFVMPLQFVKLIWASLIGYYIFLENMGKIFQKCSWLGD